MAAAVLILVVLSLAVAGRADAATTIVVTTVADTVAADGACSLREAILAANTNTTVNECVHNGSGGTDTISFNIAGAGPHVINVAVGGLPTITAPVVIDGSLEPGFAGTPVMVLNGAAAGVGANGFSVAAGAANSTIRGFVIQGFAVSGIVTDAVGTIVEGNYIGTTITGNGAFGNGLGISVNGDDVRVGGSTAAARNVISGNLTNGIRVEVATSGGTIQGNRIGVDVSGTIAVPNGPGRAPPNEAGILVFGTDYLIGGPSAGQGNVISGNRGAGINVQPGANGQTIQGNIIGLNAAGGTAIANGSDGILVTNASGAIIGGVTGTTPGGACTGACNLISGNQDSGVSISGAGPVRNLIAGNSIDRNGGLGIDLGANGVTPNDADDADAGPNNLQNFPVLTQARTNGSATQVLGSLTGTANTAGLRVEFFSSPACDGSGNGEGRVFLGATTVNTVGTTGSFNVNTLPATTAGQVITATATDPQNDTSEFSACLAVVATPASLIVVSPTSGLTTTELGGQAVFSVVLSSVPLANVTIPVSSSDTTEGTITIAQLVFTPANALIPQQVTITGVDDALLDGNVPYQIVLGVATSTDIAFNGVDPPDVSVTNVDNEQAATPTPTSTVTPTPTGTPVPEAAVNDPNNQDEKPHLTEDQRRQKAHTNRSGRDDEHVEGNVLEVRCSGEPYRIVVIANRDGSMDVRLIKDAARMCQHIKVGDYLVADGEKQNEQLFEADSVDVDR